MSRPRLPKARLSSSFSQQSLSHKGSPYSQTLVNRVRRVRGQSPGTEQRPLPPPIHHYSHSTHLTSLLDQDRSAQRLDLKLTERLRDVQSGAHLDVYSEVFQEAIRLDKPFGPLLAKIKSAYDESIRESGEMERLTQQLKAADRALQQEREDKQLLLRKLEKLAKENAELSRTLDEREAVCEEFEDKWQALERLDVSTLPKDMRTWQFLVSENSNYQRLFTRMDEDLQEMRSREKKLLRLLLALKHRGVPVDQVYEEEFSPQDSTSESEPLVEGPPRTVIRPAAVPALHLEQIYPESEAAQSAASVP